jgi:diguanylate cyclase (GGDEF)-like protein/PAS domain S-box-containing protein
MLEHANNIIQSMQTPFIALDKSLKVVSANPSFYNLFKVKPENTIGQLIYEMGDRQWSAPELRESLVSLLLHRSSLDNYCIEHDFAFIGQRVMRLNAHRVEITQGKELIILLAIEDITERADELVIANKEKVKWANELVIDNKEKDYRADELIIANKEKVKLADELVIANEEKVKRADELGIAKKEKIKRADALIIANKEEVGLADELVISKKEKIKRAEELGITNTEKNKLTDELVIANKEKVKLADELIIAKKEKVKRADELGIANKEKDKRANELVIAKKEKIKRANELDIAKKEKVKRAEELGIAKKEKIKRADELIIANEEKELLLLKLKRAASVFSHTQEGIIIVDASGIIIEVNDSFSRISGYSADEVLGKNPRILRSGRHPPKFYTEMWDTLLAKGTWSGEIWNLNKDGEIHPIYMAISAVKNTAGLVQHYVALSTDIAPMKAYQGQLERMAHYDMLTNMPNRVLLADRLNEAMLQCQSRNRSLAVAFMDLDGFKAVNDQHGHYVGDELLVEVSKSMKQALREGDTLARIGGDEFIAVMVDLQSIEDSVPVLKRLLKAAAEPVAIGGAIMHVSVSIGVTLYPQNGVDADLLMRHADQAMLVAKHEGKNRYHLFDTALANADKMKLQSISDVKTALAKGEFVMHYQPKVNMHTGEVIGCEGLIRWQHPNRGLIPPLEFLPAIEGHSVSLELGEWVIDTALTQIGKWQKKGLNLPISVNISAYQLQQANFTSHLAALLATHLKVNPSCLELEILETSVLNDINQVSATMADCHKIGVRFALDDFGTGYSSLSHLRRLPAYLIKIDQSFVRDMLEDSEDLAIVEGVLGLAKAFRRDVIAEGVETIAHGVALLELGCLLAQGYGIARPMPGCDIPKWISIWRTDDSWQALRLIETNELDH